MSNLDVKLTSAEYKKMQRQLSKLAALEAGGVDNWEWYGESLSGWAKENEIDELADEFLDCVNDLSVDADVDFPAGRECGHSVTMPQEEIKELFLSFAEKYLKIKGGKK